MITVPFAVMVVGATAYLVFSKAQKVADPQLAEIGRLMLFVGLFFTIAGSAVKTLL